MKTHKTNFFRLLMACLLISVTASTAQAQFLKKLGKALDKALETPSTSASSGSSSGKSKASSNTTTLPNGMTIVNPIADLKVEYNGLRYEYGQQVLYFTLTNTGSTPMQIENFEKMRNYDAGGGQYDSRSTVGNVTTSLGNGNFTFEPAVPVKCSICLLECPLKTAKMSLMQLRTVTYDKKKGYEDKFIEFRNVSMMPEMMIPESALAVRTYCKSPASKEYRQGMIVPQLLDDNYVSMRLSYVWANNRKGQVDRLFIGKMDPQSNVIAMYETTGLKQDQSPQTLMAEAQEGPDITSWDLTFDLSTGYFSFNGDTFDTLRGW